MGGTESEMDETRRCDRSPRFGAPTPRDIRLSRFNVASVDEGASMPFEALLLGVRTSLSFCSRINTRRLSSRLLRKLEMVASCPSAVESLSSAPFLNDCSSAFSSSRSDTRAWRDAIVDWTDPSDSSSESREEVTSRTLDLSVSIVIMAVASSAEGSGALGGMGAASSFGLRESGVARCSSCKIKPEQTSQRGPFRTS